MTYEDLMALYMQSGGGAMAPLYGGSEGAMQEQMMPVQLPDGRFMMPTAGGFQFIDPSSSNAPGGMQTGSFTGADGVSSPFQYQNPDNSLWDLAKPVVGSLGLMAGGAALAGALPGFGAAAGGGAATGGAATSMTPEIGAAMAGAGGTASYGAAPAVAGATGGLLGGAGAALGGIGSAIASNPQLAGAALGGLAGAFAGNEDTTETRESGLASWQLPAGQRALSRAEELSNRPFQPYTGPGVAGMNAEQTLAIDQVRDRAVNQDPLVGLARNQQADVIRGQMLNSNPYLAQVQRGVADRMGEGYATGTRGALTSGAQLSGNDPRYSSAYQQNVFNADRAFGDSLGQAMAGMSMQNYGQERQAQDTASRASLGFSNDSRINTEGLLNAGTQWQGNQQAQNNYQRSEWDRQQAWPTQNLGILQNAINPAYGQQSSQTTPGVGTAQGLIGGAISGLGIQRALYPQAQAPMQSQLWGTNQSPWSQQQLNMNNGSMWGGW